MGVVRSGLVTVAALGLFGLVSAAGCSAAGDADDLGDTDAPNEGGAQLPPPSATDGSTAFDGGAKDSGKKDSSVDAGPPPPEPGTPCTNEGEVREKPCGACGKQETICLADGDAGDAGGNAWTEYSACDGETPGGCIPGTTEKAACGNCGTLTQTCTKYCAWQKTACAGQPKDSCAPSSVELSSAGCPAEGTYRANTCPSTCMWTVGQTCSAPPTTVEVPATPGGTSYTVAKLSPSQVMDRLSGTCPTAKATQTLSTYKNTQYVYLQVHNGQPKSAVVTIFTKQAPGGGVISTILATYDSATPPANDGARIACAKGVATSGDAAITGDVKFASLHDTKAVTIPAGATVTVYVAGETNAATNTGPFQLGVRTDSLD